MLSCKRASELIDKQSVFKLTWKENVQLHIHTTMCDACATYQKQSNLLDSLLSKHIQNVDESQVPIIANNSLKEKIIKKL